MGDGGGANDPFGNGQRRDTLLGKMLRIDIDKKSANKIYAIPSDNPFVHDKKTLPPIVDYPRSVGVVVIGGYVYRGSAIPFLVGTYLYGDYGNGRIWGLLYAGGKVIQHGLLLETNRNISSFGEDAKGELYLVDHTGEVLKIVLGK